MRRIGVGMVGVEMALLLRSIGGRELLRLWQAQ
jgi:hypothetical protein